MRIVNVVAVAATVLIGFAGSMTAAQAMTSADPLFNLPIPLPILSSPAPAAEPATALTVTYRAEAKAAPQVWTLECDPTGGDHPDADGACATLAEAVAADADPFAPVPKDQMCTFVYGGPQTATVEGEWRGEVVDARFTRVNGCEISRWDALKPLLPAAKAAAQAG